MTRMQTRSWTHDLVRPAKRFVPEDVRLSAAGAIEYRGVELRLLSDGGLAEGALRAFLGLADETEPGSFVQFARTWGVLGLCAHGLNHYHQGCDAFDPMRELAIPTAAFTAWRSEPIDAWRARARELRAFLRLGMQLQRDMPGAESDWATALGHLFGEPIASGARALQDRKALLASGLSQRIAEAGIVPALEWSEDDQTPSLYLRLGRETPSYVPDALYAVLVVQLVAAVSVAIPECSNCKEPCAIGPNERLLRGDRRVFCSDRCRDEVDRERKRLWAAKQRTKDAAVTQSGARRRTGSRLETFRIPAAMEDHLTEMSRASGHE